jgi:hypothetical protein
VHDLAEAASGDQDGGEVGEESAYGADPGAPGRTGPAPGTPHGLVPLGDVASPDLLSTLLERLETEQIPYVVQAGTALALVLGRNLEYPGAPDAWSSRVLVVGSYRREARAIVDEVVAAAKEEALGGRAARAAADPFSPAAGS